MDKLITFQRFVSRAEAEDAVTALQAQGIQAVLSQDRALLDQNFVGQRFDNDIQLKIPGNEFRRALHILIDASKVDLKEVPADYMLLSFSTPELKEVIARPDEWGVYNYNIAMALMKERGEIVDTTDLDTVLENRNTALSAPRELSLTWYLFGYGFSIIGIIARLLGSVKVLWLLYGFYGLPGILGAVLGAYILFTKRTLLDGTRIWSFSPAARKHGLFIALLAVIAWSLVILLGLFYASPDSGGF